MGLLSRCGLVVLLLVPLTQAVRASDFIVDGVPLPQDVRVAEAGPSVPVAHKRFLGAWVGAWGGVLRHVLVVEEVRPNGSARVLYAVGQSTNVRPEWGRHEARITGDALTIVASFTATYTLEGSDRASAKWQRGQTHSQAAISKIDLAELIRPGAHVAWTQAAGAAATPGEPASANSSRDAATAFDGAMRAWMAKRGVGRASIAVMRNDRLVLASGYGGRGANERVGVWSLSKAITAVCVATLVQDRRLGFDDPIGPLLVPMFKKFGQLADKRVESITVGQLIQHRSGYPRVVGATALPQALPKHYDYGRRERRRSSFCCRISRDCSSHASQVLPTSTRMSATCCSARSSRP